MDVLGTLIRWKQCPEPVAQSISMHSAFYPRDSVVEL